MLLSGSDELIAAGRLRLKRGKIAYIDNLSGHFQPKVNEAENLKSILEIIKTPVKRANYKIFNIITNSENIPIKQELAKNILLNSIK